MNARAEARRLARDTERAVAAIAACEDRVPVVPGVIRDGSVEALREALDEAHQSLPLVPGTRVEVVTYERAAGLRVVEDMFGLRAAVIIAVGLDREGPDALVVLAMRVPFSWHRTQAGEFCCSDPGCPAMRNEAG